MLVFDFLMFFNALLIQKLWLSQLTAYDGRFAVGELRIKYNNQNNDASSHRSHYDMKVSSQQSKMFHCGYENGHRHAYLQDADFLYLKRWRRYRDTETDAGLLERLNWWLFIIITITFVLQLLSSRGVSFPKPCFYIGLKMLPLDSFMLNLYSQLGYHTRYVLGFTIDCITVPS